MFELRVLKSFCRVVTVLTSPISGIRVFLSIFFLGILAFSMALLHLIHTYLSAQDAKSGDSPKDSTFPVDLVGAFFDSFLILVRIG